LCDLAFDLRNCTPTILLICSLGKFYWIWYSV